MNISFCSFVSNGLFQLITVFICEVYCVKYVQLWFKIIYFLQKASIYTVLYINRMHLI